MNPNKPNPNKATNRVCWHPNRNILSPVKTSTRFKINGNGLVNLDCLPNPKTLLNSVQCAGSPRDANHTLL